MAKSVSGPGALNGTEKNGSAAGAEMEAWEPLPSIHPFGKPSHVLLVATGSIRDAAPAASIAPTIKAFYKNVRVTAVCRRCAAEIFEACPSIDDVFPFAKMRAYQDETHRESLLRRLREMEIDAAFNVAWSREPIADLLVVGSRARDRVGFDGDCFYMEREVKESHDRFYTALLPGPEGIRPEVARYRDFLNGLGIPAEPLDPVIRLAPGHEAFADRFFRQNQLTGKKTIAFFIDSQREIHGCEPYGEALSRICRENNFTVIALGGASEYSECGSNLEAIGAPGVNACGETTILQAAAILKRCRLAVGAEGGLAHIARAVEIPHVILPGGGQFG
ncbi:MAG: glycosyltransferase family 9 protein, partial [Desulfobacterales bacterium]|nr:glycosyltransferase family 9 protein [Desulfobacterales bacterium]